MSTVESPAHPPKKDGPPTPIDRLKAGIWDIHEGVSGGEKKEPAEQDNIMKGTLPLHKYISNLAQRFLMQTEFEVVLRDSLSSPFISAVVTDEQFHAPKAAADLRFFGVDPSTVAPLPSNIRTISFFNETARRDVRLVLAIHYVIEGSNNGAFFIAKAVKKAYNLEGTDGTFHLQPYGPAVREKWAGFRDAFNALPIDETLLAEMIRAGRRTFELMNEIGRESYAQAKATT